MLLQQAFFLLLSQLLGGFDLSNQLIVRGAHITIVIDSILHRAGRILDLIALVEILGHFGLFRKHLLSSLLVELSFALRCNFKQFSFLLLIVLILLLFLAVDRFHLLLNLKLDLLVIDFATISQQLQVKPVHLGGCRV